MKARAGFTLVELLVATFVASLLLGLLFTVYAQVRSGTTRFDAFTQQHTSLALLESIVVRDVSGACVPLSVLYDGQQKKEKKSVEQGEQPKTITAIFKAVATDKLTHSFTCITNNQLASYRIKGMGKPKPWFLRISYKLENDTKVKGTYRLMRQEAVDLQETSSAPWYELVSGIKQFELTFVSYEEQEGEQKTWKMTKHQEWNSDDNDPEDEKNYLPDLIVIRVVFARRSSFTGQTYECVIPLLAKTALPKQEMPEKDKQPATPTEKSGKAEQSALDKTPSKDQKQEPKADSIPGSLLDVFKPRGGSVTGSIIPESDEQQRR